MYDDVLTNYLTIYQTKNNKSGSANKTFPLLCNFQPHTRPRAHATTNVAINSHLLSRIVNKSYYIDHKKVLL